MRSPPWRATRLCSLGPRRQTLALLSEGVSKRLEMFASQLIWWRASYTGNTRIWQKAPLVCGRPLRWSGQSVRIQLLHLFDAFKFPIVGRSCEKYFRCSLLFQLKHHVIFFSSIILFNEILVYKISHVILTILCYIPYGGFCRKWDRVKDLYVYLQRSVNIRDIS